MAQNRLNTARQQARHPDPTTLRRLVSFLTSQVRQAFLVHFKVIGRPAADKVQSERRHLPPKHALPQSNQVGLSAKKEINSLHKGRHASSAIKDKNVVIEAWNTLMKYKTLYPSAYVFCQT